jgi:ATP-dependent RNA circularization protein (DNA/RNA ligase family)
MKYPRIPHVPFSNITDVDDIVLDDRWMRSLFFGEEWVITEKIDGSQTSFEFIDGKIEARNRNTKLLEGGMDRQYTPLPSWISCHYDDLWQMIGNGLILFGEWMFHVHTVEYSSLPDWFLCFDLYDKNRASFLPFESAMETCRHHGFATVPIITRTVIRSKEHLLSYIGKSAFTSGQMEGIVMHSIDGNTHVKLVTEAFKNAVDMERHWKVCTRVKNAVRK